MKMWRWTAVGAISFGFVACGEDHVTRGDHDRAMEEITAQLEDMRQQLREATDQTARYRQHLQDLNSLLIRSVDEFDEQMGELLEEQGSLQESAHANYEQFEDRIARIEQALIDLHPETVNSPEFSEDGTPQSGQSRVVQIVGIETLPPDHSSAEEIHDLRQRAERLREQARQLDREIVDLLQVYRDWELRTRRGIEYRDRYRDRMAENRSKRRALVRQRQRLLGEARQLDGQATRLERESEIPRQRITGISDEITIVLITERDFSRQLSRLADRAWITWSGRLTARDESTETWIVTRIEQVDPPNWVE
jgi:chromosome segregation ATPase